jgi:hypothetical protein
VTSDDSWVTTMGSELIGAREVTYSTDWRGDADWREVGPANWDWRRVEVDAGTSSIDWRGDAD